jgi:hypothetical protein
MIKDYYRIRLEGEKFEQLLKGYFKYTRFKPKIEKTFFKSIGILKASYLFYSVRCIYSKKNDDLVVCVNFSSLLSFAHNNFSNYFAAFALLLIVLGSYVPIISLVILLIFLSSLVFPAMDKYLVKKLYKKESPALYGYISRNISDIKSINGEEYDSLITDRYTFRE